MLKNVSRQSGQGENIHFHILVYPAGADKFCTWLSESKYSKISIQTNAHLNQELTIKNWVEDRELYLPGFRGMCESDL